MQKLNDFIGKKQIKENLFTFINSSKKNKKILDHILIFGQPGMGKTTIAKLIAKELNTRIKIIQGPEVQKKSDIINIIYFLKEGNILFIDEIHSMNKNCYEILYALMDDFKINIKIGKEGNEKLTTLDVPKFTLIGATTLLGEISDPLEDRFGITIFLNYYSNEEMIKILTKTIDKNTLSKNEILEIAKRSKGTPRIGKKILKRVIDFKNHNKDLNIYEIFKKLKIYEKGINENDVLYLNTISKHKNISIKTISQILFIDEKTIERKIEPYLFKINFIEKNNKGRKLSKEAINFLQKNNIL